jgi:hypothetical protein
MQTRLIFASVFFALMGVGQAPAQEQSVQPGVNDQYKDPDQILRLQAGGGTRGTEQGPERKLLPHFPESPHRRQA